MNWEVSQKANYGHSSATDWSGLIPDLAAALQATLDECVVSGRTALYVEMWSDTGRFICYPAVPPVAGELADRDTEFLVQLAVPFWAEAWSRVSFNSADSALAYEELEGHALTALTAAFEVCQDSGIVLYAFEYEGSERIAVITKRHEI